MGSLLFIFILTSLVTNSCATSIIPEPVGPFYGLPFSTRTAARLPIPTTAFGTCEEGTVYNITKPGDLRFHAEDLQCIFSAGVTPSKVPEGPQYGRVLVALNSRTFIVNPLVNLIWRGNYAFKAQCNNSDSEPVYIGFHNAVGRSFLPTLLYVGVLSNPLAPGEHDDGKGSVVMDFIQDLTKVCKDYGDFVARNKSSLPVHVTTLVNIYPQTQVYDVFRLVGRQRDGGKIYLGKTYLRDYYKEDQQMATIAFWYLINYDNEVNPEFKIGQALPPLEKGFSYMFPGVVDIVLRYLPVDNLIFRPLQTISRFAVGARNVARATRANILEFFRQTGQRRSNRRRLQEYWQSGRKPRTHEDVLQ